jgi:hypothetical protein
LAVLTVLDTFKTIGLPVSIEELTVVANSFHTKPLRRYLQSVERYNVLGLNLNDYQIYEGNRHSLTELEPSDIPKNINEALGYDLTDKHTTVASYGGVGNQTTTCITAKVENQMKRISIPKSFSLCRKTINDNYSVLPVCHLYWLHYQSISIFS